MADAATMDNTINPSADLGIEYAVSVARKAIDQRRKEGEAVVKLIEASDPVPDAEGRGAHVDTRG